MSESVIPTRIAINVLNFVDFAVDRRSFKERKFEIPSSFGSSGIEGSDMVRSPSIAICKLKKNDRLSTREKSLF